MYIITRQVYRTQEHCVLMYRVRELHGRGGDIEEAQKKKKENNTAGAC
jgi:hypothetical protein